VGLVKKGLYEDMLIDLEQQARFPLIRRWRSKDVVEY
jgi:hypothetical protein